ncbi:MAG: MarR family winged helix-turn-helix transcriptional regulator [Fimbriimonadaceae bacterium]
MRRPNETLSGQAQLLTELMHGLVGPVLEHEHVSGPTFELLTAIHATQGKASQARIAEVLGVRPPTLCESVKVAVRQGLIVQEANPRDKRAKRLALTSKGNKVVRKALESMRTGEAAMVAGIADDQLDAAIETIAAAVRNLAIFEAKSDDEAQ